MATARERLRAVVEAMTEIEAERALALVEPASLASLDPIELDAEESAFVAEGIGQAERGEVVSLEQLDAQLRTTIDRVRAQRKAG
jgi:hypothetical protein